MPLYSFTTAFFIFYHMVNTIRSAVRVAAAAWRAGGPSAEFVSNENHQRVIPDAFLLTALNRQKTNRSYRGDLGNNYPDYSDMPTGIVVMADVFTQVHEE